MSYHKYLLTIPQQNIWNLQRYYPDTAIANLCGAVFYREKRREDLLEQAINQVIRSQSGLRMRFSEESGQPVQAIKEFVYEKVPVQEFSSYEEFETYAKKAAAAPIGLTDRKMYRFEIFRVEGVNGVLALLSHLISDAWAFSLVGKGIDKAYRELAAGQAFSDKTYDYTDCIKAEAEYLESPKFGKDEKFWKERYGKKPEPAFVKAGSGQTACIEANRYSRKLALSVAHRIREFSRDTGITEAVLFETALGIYLSRLNPENRTVTMGTPVLNRSNVREKNTIGIFISTLPLTVEISWEDTVLQAAKKITAEHGNLFRHQKYPYSKILENIRENHEFSGSLYEVMVSYQNAQMDEGSDTKWFGNGYSETPFVFHIDNRDRGDTFTITVDYQTRRFSQAEEISLIVDRLEYILQQMTENGERLIGEISILPEREEERILLDFNRTFGEYPRELCVHQLFTEQAKRTPEKTALVFENKSFSYRELEEMSNSLAFLLRENGIGPNMIVPILAKRSWHIVVAMLGVLKAGGAYMPVSPDYPMERIGQMIEISKAKLVLQYGYEKELPVESWNLGQLDFSCHKLSVSNRNRSSDLCYVIFTSGSTGEPKGISLCHRNVVNYCWEHPCNLVSYKMKKSGLQRIVSVTNIVFDIFVTESLLPLIHGMTVYFANDSQVYQQGKLSRLIRDYGIEVLQTTPSKMRSYLGEEGDLEYLKSLKCLILGGEALPGDLVETIRRHTDAPIFNIYGPAETTVWSSNKEVEKAEDITLGRPIANTQIYILDKNRKLQPVGIAGEIGIAGDGVGKGYLNRSELTVERFVPNPFATEENGHGKILYLTGDLGSWRADGEVEYWGRGDAQVKIRGLRIELGEIESAMSRFPGITMAAVTDGLGRDCRQYLAGYYTARQEIDERKLRRYLSAKLPKYMVPNYFLRLDEMPMTASGKTDRKRLPKEELGMVYTKKGEYIPPETDTEKAVSAIWKNVLHVERAGKREDFWDLGGDSLLAIQVLNQIESQLQVEISVKEILENSSLEELAAVIERAKGTEDMITIHGRKKYCLLPQQKAIYAACQKEPECLTYNMPAEIKLPESIDRDRLRDSIIKTVNFHKSLKTYIALEGETIYGIYDETAEVIFEEYEKETKHKFLRPFDLGKAPLVHVGFTEDGMLFDIHHIIADGESLNIILRNIKACYEREEGYLEEKREKGQAEYSDYAEYFWRKDFTRHKEFFKGMLSCDFESVLLPERTEKGLGGGSKVFLLPENVCYKVKNFAKAQNLTETMAFLGAYGILLAKFTGKTDVLTSMILSNRTHGTVQNTVGMFVNTLPIYFKAKGKTNDYFRYIKELVLNLFKYQELPFVDIADIVGMKDRTVINTSFVYQGGGEKKLFFEGEDLEVCFTDTHTSKFDFTMEITPGKKEYFLRLEYARNKYEESLMDRLFQAYIQILYHLQEEEIRNIPVLSEAERQRILVEFNSARVKSTGIKCVHELFQEQAERTPEKVGLVFENRKFTYRQLDEMSNALGCFLREKGVRPNDVIPIIAERSWHVVVAMLGVLKAGGAFTLIDCRYPEKRIAYLVGECRAEIVLTYGCVYSNGIDLENFPYETRTISMDNRNNIEDLFCAIHTSGSTGFPKMATLKHANLVHFIKHTSELFKGTNQAISTTIITFDAFLQETIVALCNQVPIILLSTIQMTRQEEFEQIVSKFERSFLFQTPTKLLNYIENSETRSFLKKISSFSIGGEVFSEKLYLKIHQVNSDCNIVNGYGPSETTIYTSMKKLTNSNLITIGKPIANTQIYILDKNSNPLPIGVPGELCIAGDGVGKGYLNRPKLTAERFVSNPFATAENRHGKVMYRTGDLACWLENGELQYLGRIDTQVKIRGLRIELGEIESVMSQIAGVRMAAVTDKRDSDGRQYLIGYYVADEELDGKELRRQLGRSLPKYMIPHYFVRLKALPMTPSGKIDRKNLPLPDFTARTGEYTAPVTEKEKRLCEILEQILGIERIGAEDDFFELGFDSLKAIELVAKTHQAGIEISLQQVFDYPTARQLCRQTEEEKKEKVLYKSSDFESFRPFLERNVVNGDFRPRKRALGNVLLTGATGFLGAHILDVLMKEETGIVYCVVRSGMEGNGEKRLKERLEYYFGSAYEKEFGKRIIPVSGDLERGDFLDEPIGDIQTVIHSAASVKHYGPYEYFYRANVLATEHIAKFAKYAGARLIHLSTLSVSGNSMADEFSGYRSQEKIEFDETSFFVGQPLDNVYIRSKFEAERKVFLAMTEGLEARIIRVGNLTNRFSDFKFQPNYKENAFLTRVKAVLELGCFPDYLLPLYAEFSPVDLTAEGVVKIAQYGEKQCVFHLNSNRPVYFDRMMEIMEKLGISMKLLDKEAFGRELDRALKHAGTEYIFEALQNDMDLDGNLVYDSNIRIKNDATLRFLKSVGFEWEKIDYEYLRGYVAYFRNLGYLEAGDEK